MDEEELRRPESRVGLVFSVKKSHARTIKAQLNSSHVHKVFLKKFKSFYLKLFF
jgi:hypothetical protein